MPTTRPEHLTPQDLAVIEIALELAVDACTDKISSHPIHERSIKEARAKFAEAKRKINAIAISRPR